MKTTDHRGLTAPQKTVLAVLFIAGIGLVGWSAFRMTQRSMEKAPDIRNLAQEVRDYLDERNVKPLSEPLDAILRDTSFTPVATQKHSLLDQSAPKFDLVDADGKSHALDAALAKGPVVVIFYYGYHCNHCVGQLFTIDRDLPYFAELGATVLAVSADPVAITRERFKKYGAFKFPVLSDPGNRVAQLYGVYTPAAGKSEENLVHGTFVVDRGGVIRWANFGDEPFTDDRTLLSVIAKLEGR